MTAYDTIGRGYAARRRPDPRIAARITAALGDARSVVNVGAGAGSYEPADRRVVAVEPSMVMISQRRAGAAPVVRAVAERLPFAARRFDAALAVLTIHHWTDADLGFRELRRVASRRVVLAFDESMSSDFWLAAEYFPATAAELAATSPQLDDLVTGLGAQQVEVVPVPHDCVDGFAGAYWRRPEAYLDPAVRAGISFFAATAPAEIEPGLARLRDDLDSGAWHARHADLLELDEVDLGYRLLVAVD
jgi:SAM-dependent methyltransferase